MFYKHVHMQSAKCLFLSSTNGVKYFDAYIILQYIIFASTLCGLFAGTCNALRARVVPVFDYIYLQEALLFPYLSGDRRIDDFTKISKLKQDSEIKLTFPCKLSHKCQQNVAKTIHSIIKLYYNYTNRPLFIYSPYA